MCTAISLKTADNFHIFGRNLDVSFILKQEVHIIPRNFNWTNIETKKKESSTYACVGMGILVDNHPLMIDGVNEKGLAGAALYFANFSKYKTLPENDRLNISGADFIYWILSKFATLEELKHTIKTLVITNTPLKDQYPVAPLHWMFTDLTGNSIVIEYTQTGLHIYDNPVGVLTNVPQFPWHIANLTNYVPLTPNSPEESQIGDLTIRPLSQGLGTLGIPGNGTSVARFVRAAFFKTHIIMDRGEVNGISSIFEVLDNVSVTKGSQISDTGDNNYTIYQSAMCQETGTYYYTTYDNQRINAISLANANLDEINIKSFPYLSKQDINYQN